MAASGRNPCRIPVTVKEELLHHVSPLGWEHINLTGDFHWNAKQTPPNGHLRPLRMKERR